jgi:hypothetical protein
MATSQVPALIDALVTNATAALPTTTVYDGFGISDDPGDFLMVGVEDPDLQGAATSAQFAQVPATMGPARTRDETGSVTCAALSWNGDGDQKAARDAAFTIVAAVESMLRNDPSQGLGPGGYFVVQFGGTGTLTQQQDDNGALALVIFTVTYRARI